MKLIELPPALRMRRQFDIWDDFLWYISPHLWTSLVADSGTSVACGTSTNTAGLLTLTTAATDNNEAAVSTTTKCFLFAAEKPLYYEVALNYTEANTDDANIYAGFSSVLGTANMMLDDGAGPAASFSGAGIFKVDGGTVWKFITSNATTQTISTSQHTAGGAQVLRVEVRQGSSGASGLEAVPFLNGQPMLDANGKPIKHTLSYTSAATMQAGFYVKAGGATSETPVLDYIAAGALR